MKIGISDIPTKRLYSLVNNCALRPLSFGAIHVMSRKLAFQIERELHKAFKPWRTRGEWFRFPVADRQKFSELRNSILDKYRKPAWPMKLRSIDVKAVMADVQRKTMAYRHYNLPPLRL